MNNLWFGSCTRIFSRFTSKNLPVFGVNNIVRNVSSGGPSSDTNSYSCKLLVIGGGAGGCTMAAKFVKNFHLTKHPVIVLEPESDHYYQPLWTLVGAGVKTISQTRREMRDVLPEAAYWLKDAAECIDPNCCEVRTRKGHTIHYEYLIIAVGLKYDYGQVPGLEEALAAPRSGVSTIYDCRYAEKTYLDFRTFEGGCSIFTYPNSIIKCPGAPQKIAYLFDSFLTKIGKRETADIMYNTCQPYLFGVKYYADKLWQVANRKKIHVNLRCILVEVDACSNVAYFEHTTENGLKARTCYKYSLLHATPPMSPPDVVRCNLTLSDCDGFLNVDKHTLQHKCYKNIFGLGDCTNTPNSKTAAAIAKQCYVVEQNLLSVMVGQEPYACYDGYGACPLLTSYSSCILAEFLYGGKVHETFPFFQYFQSSETRLAYHMKKDLFPFIYWNFMLKGNYHGPEFIRKMINPEAWKEMWQKA